MSAIAPIPWYVPVLQLDPTTGKPLPTYGLSKEFGNWLQTSVVGAVASTAQFYPSVSLTGQTASIGVTPMPLPALATGIYRVTYYARITTADGVSSSLTITLGWTESTVTLSLSGAAMTGDSTTTVQTATAMVIIDAATPISYSTTYASNTPAKMTYRLTFLVEAV